MSNGQSNESINSLNESQNAKVVSGTPLRKVSQLLHTQLIVFNIKFLMQSFNDSITNSFGDYAAKFGELDSSVSSTLDTSNNLHSNSSYLTDEVSPRSSPGGVTIQPINFVRKKGLIE